MTILETRKKIEEINAKYDSQIAELSIQIANLEQQKQDELGNLTGEYDAMCSKIIEDYEAGTYVKIPGVYIRELKSVVIFDESKIPPSYMKYSVNDKKVKADIKESGYTLKIPGTKVVTKYSVAVKLK